MYININGLDFNFKEVEDFSDLYEYAAYSVEGFYDKPSWAKKNAEADIKRDMKKVDGYGYGVSRGSKFVFSAFWFLKLDDEEFLVKETISNRFLYGPKTLTIKNAIEDVKAEKRRKKKEEKEKEINLESV